MAHTASVRVRPATFTHVNDEWRVTYPDDARAWEVMCPDCGDDGGPIDLQPEPARALRGPYPTQDEAWRVATHHGG